MVPIAVFAEAASNLRALLSHWQLHWIAAVDLSKSRKDGHSGTAIAESCIVSKLLLFVQLVGTQSARGTEAAMAARSELTPRRLGRTPSGSCADGEDGSVCYWDDIFTAGELHEIHCGLRKRLKA